MEELLRGGNDAPRPGAAASLAAELKRQSPSDSRPLRVLLRCQHPGPQAVFAHCERSSAPRGRGGWKIGADDRPLPACREHGLSSSPAR